MTKHIAAIALQEELKKINKEIDVKIIRGKSYSREARRHKSLLSQLAFLNYKRFGFLSLL
jgi:hypothetical protein